MQVSKRFLALLKQQLAQFADRPDLRMLVVYAALPRADGEPSLLSIANGQTALALQNGMSARRRRQAAHAAGCPTGWPPAAEPCGSIRTAGPGLRPQRSTRSHRALPHRSALLDLDNNDSGGN